MCFISLLPVSCFVKKRPFVINLVAQYVTPKGTVIQSKGLIPDLEVPTANAYVNLLLPDALKQPNLDAIDFSKVKQISDACDPVKSS